MQKLEVLYGNWSSETFDFSHHFNLKHSHGFHGGFTAGGEIRNYNVGVTSSGTMFIPCFTYIQRC
jgi:hypothetical protein